MSDGEEVKFCLKVMINKQKNKVLFAEADSEFADVLLSFLTLPLGTIVRVLKKHYGDKAPVIGSLNNLYKKLANLDSSHFWTEGCKQMLLNPRNSFEAECRKLKLNVDDNQPTKYFRCGDRDCKRKRSPIVSMYHENCDCGKSLSKPMGTLIESKITQSDVDGDGDGGAFTEKRASFLITDDLKMVPVVQGSIVQTLIDLGVTITDGAKLRTVTIGFNEIIDLLRGSLLSSTPLTDLIVHQRHKTNGVTRKFLPHQMEIEPSSNSKKMIVKAWVRESTHNLLFVQAEEDFVDFLFSLLVIPLGQVEYLLGSNTLLGSIDNLYKSIANFIDDKFFKMPDTRNRLMKPELPPNYLSKNQIFSLSEQMNPNIYYVESITVSPEYTVEKGSWMHFKDPKGDEGSYVKRPQKFLVTDRLNVHRNVSPSAMIDKLKFSDVKELELHIGLKEALSILKASLTSTYALSTGLKDLIVEKLANQEH